MIYLQAPGGRFRVVVLATAEVDRIKGAAPILSPDKSLMIAWTPDPEWLLERIRTGAGSSNDIALAIDQAASRPEAGMLLGADGSPLPSTSPNGKPHAPAEERLSNLATDCRSLATELTAILDAAWDDQIAAASAKVIQSVAKKLTLAAAAAEVS